MTRTSISRYSRRALTRLSTLGLLLLIATAQSADANSVLLREVRVGPHRSFDRLVFELSGKTDYSINADSPERLVVRLRNADVADGFQLSSLPENLECIRFLEAYRIGSTDLELDVALKNRSFHTGFVLEGKPWRLVIDFSVDPLQPPADANKSKPNAEPEYVPGDRPIETRFAETQTQTEHTPAPEPMVAATIEQDSCLEQHAETPQGPLAEQSIDSSAEESATEIAEVLPEESETDSNLTDLSKANEVLREFYLVLGDTERANHFAKNSDEIVPFVGEQVDTHYILRAITSLFIAQPWLFFAAALLFGLMGGLAGLWINAKFFRIGMNPATMKTPKPAKQKKKKGKPFEVEEPAQEMAEELEKDMGVLERAVEEEPKSKEEPDLGPLPEAYQTPPEEPVTVDAEVKETAMERRVKRVLELSKDGADISSIAKQLEMSQDEVKLILDLN